LATIGILETPFVIPSAVSQAISDHRLIVPFVMAFAVRVLFIGFFSKIWWDTRVVPPGGPARSSSNKSA